MINPNTDPHELAVLELEKWDEQGIKHAFDPEAIVMADLYPRKFYPDRYKEQKND